MCKSIAVVILVIINFVFAAAGCLMLAFGIAAAAQPDSIVQMLSFTGNLTQLASEAGFNLVQIIQHSAVFLIVMGAVVALVGLFGCVGACCRVKCMLGAYIIILVIILLAEIALIIFAAVFPDKFKGEVQPGMKLSLTNQYKSDGNFNQTANGYVYQVPPTKTEMSWISMQFEIGCCGATGYQDYTSPNISWTRTDKYPQATVPVSCCKLKDGPGKIPKTEADFADLNGCLGPQPVVSSINENNCYDQLELLLKQYGRIGIGIAAGIIGVEIVLIILAAWICRSIGTDTTKAI